MSRRTMTLTLWALFLAVAVLLPAGVLSLTSMEPGSAPTAVERDVAGPSAS